MTYDRSREDSEHTRVRVKLFNKGLHNHVLIDSLFEVFTTEELDLATSKPENAILELLAKQKIKELEKELGESASDERTS